MCFKIKLFDKTQFMNMNNLKLYLIFCFLSIFLIVISYLINNEFLNVLKNISYSILAATFIALIIDYNNLQIEQKNINKFRSTYLEEMNIHLSLIIGHLLWLEGHLTDELINWNLEPQAFLEIDFAIFFSKYYENEEITFDNALKRLKKISKKYSIDKMNEMSEQEKANILKMFQIASLECRRLLVVMDTLYKDKIILDVKNYVSLKDTDQLVWDISLCKKIMEKEDSNYEIAIHYLISSAEIIKKIGNYDNMISIGFDEGFVEFDKL